MSMESLTASAVPCNPASKTMRVMTSSSTSSSSSAFVRIPCSSGSLTRLKLMVINNTERTSVSCSALEVILGQ